jgi:two-component sensor histidine kinase
MTTPDRPDPDSPRPSTPSAAGAPAAQDQQCHLVLVADPATPGRVRDRVRAWLTAIAWPTRQIDAIQLALGEAVTNAVEHAYAPGHTPRPHRPENDNAANNAANSIEDSIEDSGSSGRWRGQIVINLSIHTVADQSRRVRAVVRDHGRWQLPASTRHRGHGLMFVAELMENLVVRPVGGNGTEVELISYPVPNPPTRP